jgi:hypothetical protein
MKETFRVARIGDGGDQRKCSFCGKRQKQVKKLIAGPGVYICDECIDLCNEIIEEELHTESSELSGDDLAPGDIHRGGDDQRRGSVAEVDNPVLPDGPGGQADHRRARLARRGWARGGPVAQRGRRPGVVVVGAALAALVALLLGRRWRQCRLRAGRRFRPPLTPTARNGPRQALSRS